MNILVTGKDGQLGFELMRARWFPGVRLIGLARADLDIRDGRAVDRAVLDHQPALTINAAAYTNVDRAESEGDAAFAVNRDGVANVAMACAARDVPVIHVSTDYVFDGLKPSAYVEEDPIAPLNVYGESKAAGESALRAHNPRHVIIRASWLYGVHGRNFVKTMLRLAATRDEIAVVDDQWGSPTAAADLASAMVAIARSVAAGSGRWGTYHYSGDGDTTWYRFARAIFDIAGKGGAPVPRLRAIATGDYPTPARRPANSRLDCGLIESTYGVRRPAWQSSLSAVLQELSTAR